MNLALDPLAILSYAEEIGSDDLYAAAERDFLAHKLNYPATELTLNDFFSARKVQLEKMIAWCEKIDREVEEEAGDDEEAFEALLAQVGRSNAPRCRAYNKWLKEVHFENVP